MEPTVHSPLCSAAVAVIGLNVEPVGPWLSIARLIRGALDAWLVSARYLAALRLDVNTLGSKLGSEPIA